MGAKSVEDQLVKNQSRSCGHEQPKSQDPTSARACLRGSKTRRGRPRLTCIEVVGKDLEKLAMTPNLNLSRNGLKRAVRIQS